MSHSPVPKKVAIALIALSTQFLTAQECEPDCGCAFSIGGSLLYWQPHEEGLDYVIQNQAGTAFANSDARIERVDPKWGLGFRIDLGYQFPCTKIELDALWTRIHTKSKSSSTASELGGLFQIWTIPGSGLSAAEYAKASWRANLDILDLKMSALFNPCCFLELTPSLSLSTAWIHQKFNIDSSGGSSTQISNAIVILDAIRMKNNYWGIGPKVGLDTSWWLFCGLSIYGNIDATILYGRFSLSQSEIVELTGLNTPITYLDIDHNKFYLSRVNLDMNIGLKWEFNAFSDWCQFSILAGWENLYLFGQNQLMRFQTVAFPGINSANQGDLSYQGLTLKLSARF